VRKKRYGVHEGKGGRTSQVDILSERNRFSLLEDLEDRVVQNDSRVVESLVGGSSHIAFCFEGGWMLGERNKERRRRPM